MSVDVQAVAERFKRRHPQQASVRFLDELASVSLVFCTHAEFLVYYKRIDTDFVYDRTSDQYLVGVKCQHVDLRASLYRYYGGVEPDNFEAADQYILRSMGMFKSRAGHRILRGADFVVPAELRPIFRDIKVLS